MIEETDEGDKSDVQGELVPFRIRPYRGESNFVAHTWLSSFKGAPANRRVDPDEYWKQHARLISKLIDRGQVFLAEHANHDVLMGHCVAEKDRQGVVIHYVYVKGDYRRTGVGRALWTAAIESLTIRGTQGKIRYTHAKMPWDAIAARQGWEYSPYPAFRLGWED